FSFKHPAQRFQDSALQIRVVSFVENFDQTGHANQQADRLVRVTKEMRREPEILAELRDQDGSSQCAENVHAGEKVSVINLTVGKQMFKRHLHENDNVVFRRIALRQKDAACAIQHIVRSVGDGAKTSALNQDRSFVEDFGGLHSLAVCLEHHRIR